VSSLPTLAPESREPPPTLVRGLNAWDGALITIGSVVGTGIFLTTSDMARALPHPGLVLLAWVVGGLLTVAGALTYAEMGALFPEAGGMYHFLKEAYGPLWGFLYGWASFLVIMSGGIAALAVGFGEYLGSFLPFFETTHVLATVRVAGWTWTFSGGQLAGVMAILALTLINYLGLKEGVWVQNALTLLKVGALALFIGLGFVAGGSSTLRAPGGVPTGALAGFGLAMIATLWTYDGWYGLTFSAGEMKDPGRSLPRGIVLGSAAVMVLYALLNVVYFRALSMDEIRQAPRIGEAAAAALFGVLGARLVSAAVVLSTFGCLSSTILYSSRIYQPMAADGVFFPSLARIHTRHRVPARSLWAQSLWAMVLTASGTYEQLYTYVVFTAVAFHAATGAAIFVLRRTHAERPRPYRTWGYPLVPALFLLASLLLVVNTLRERPMESGIGLVLVALGLPAYAFWRKKAGKPLAA
jgi:APA family basic amino acid/polyamine antiporter